MTGVEVYKDYVQPYRDCPWILFPERGFIVWRLGTGANVELLHVRAFERRKGHGRRLVYAMLEELRATPPYHSVFGFTRVSNERAAAFYSALGFRLQPVKGLYADGEAVMFWREYSELLRLKEEHEIFVRR